MNPQVGAVENLSQPETSRAESGQERTLPSGRSVVLKVAGSREELEVRSPQGEVEVHITLTESGPVVRLRGARLELESPETVAISCRRFEVHAEEGTELATGGTIRMTGQELRVRTQADIHLDGDYIRLNCEDAVNQAPAPQVQPE